MRNRLKNRDGKGLGKWLWSFMLAVAIIIVYKSFDRLSDVFSTLGNFISIATPIIWAGIISYFLVRPAAFFERQLKKVKKIPFIPNHARGLSVLIVYPLFIGALALIVGLMIPALAESLVTLFGNMKGYFATATEWIEDFSAQYHIVDDLNIMPMLLEWFKTIIETIDVSTIVSSVGSILSVGSTISSIIVTFIIAVYALLDRENILAAFKRIFSLFLNPPRLESFCSYLSRCNKVVYKYFVGQLSDCLLVVFMSSIALAIIGVENWFLFGFIFGMFNLIPTFGPIIAGIAVVFIILMAHGFKIAIISAVVLLALQQIDANIINPKILGDSLDMSPFWVMVAIIVGGGVGGFVGMLIGVPVAAIIRLVYRDVLILQKKRREKAALAAASDTAQTAAETVTQEAETAAVQAVKAAIKNEKKKK